VVPETASNGAVQLLSGEKRTRVKSECWMSRSRIQKLDAFLDEFTRTEQPLRGSYRHEVSGAYGVIDESESKVIRKINGAFRCKFGRSRA